MAWISLAVAPDPSPRFLSFLEFLDPMATHSRKPTTTPSVSRARRSVAAAVVVEDDPEPPDPEVVKMEALRNKIIDLLKADADATPPRPPRTADAIATALDERDLLVLLLLADLVDDEENSHVNKTLGSPSVYFYKA